MKQLRLTKLASTLSAVAITISMPHIMMAAPTGGRVTQGSATIEQTSNTRIDINQSSDKAIINWDSFSIKQGERVNFNQPRSSSVALNRVTGGSVSDIQGALTANGQVFLINPNGIVFGKNATVDVAGLIASTSDINDSDFMNGKFEFTGSGSGSIVNEGNITVKQGGLVALVAPTVRNSGVIQAKLGRVALVSGNTFTVDLYGDGLIKLAVDDKVAQSLVQNTGTITASGGKVLISAEAARNIVDNIVNISGVVQAKSISVNGGSVNLSGTLDATASGKGGTIDVLGNSINVTGTIDASGNTGGGTIHIGGDFQGKGNRQRASETIISSSATIQANANTQGDGGRIIVWSDNNTQVDGQISATGGALSGNGGFVETSSAGTLDFSTSVDVSAPNGRAGTWLIDPENIVIDGARASLIENSLNEGSSVSIKTSDAGTGEGNIDVNAPINKTAGGDASLSLTAHNNININAPITSTSGKLNVTLDAGNNINRNSPINPNGGSVSEIISSKGPESEIEEESSPENNSAPEQTNGTTGSTSTENATTETTTDSRTTSTNAPHKPETNSQPQAVGAKISVTEQVPLNTPAYKISPATNQTPLDTTIKPQQVDGPTTEVNLESETPTDTPNQNENTTDTSTNREEAVFQNKPGPETDPTPLDSPTTPENSTVETSPSETSTPQAPAQETSTQTQTPAATENSNNDTSSTAASVSTNTEGSQGASTSPETPLSTPEITDVEQPIAEPQASVPPATENSQPAQPNSGTKPPVADITEPETRVTAPSETASQNEASAPINNVVTQQDSPPTETATTELPSSEAFSSNTNIDTAIQQVNSVISDNKAPSIESSVDVPSGNAEPNAQSTAIAPVDATTPEITSQEIVETVVAPETQHNLTDSSETPLIELFIDKMNDQTQVPSPERRAQTTQSFAEQAQTEAEPMIIVVTGTEETASPRETKPSSNSSQNRNSGFQTVEEVPSSTQGNENMLAIEEDSNPIKLMDEMIEQDSALTITIEDQQPTIMAAVATSDDNASDTTSQDNSPALETIEENTNKIEEINTVSTKQTVVAQAPVNENNSLTTQPKETNNTIPTKVTSEKVVIVNSATQNNQTTTKTPAVTAKTEDKKAAKSTKKVTQNCATSSHFVWLQSGIRSAAETADMGRGGSISKDIFKNCFK